MGKTAYIKARIEPKLKAQAAKVLARAGVSMTDAITMFMRQVVLQKDLPVEVRAPNAESRQETERELELKLILSSTASGWNIDSILKPRKKRKS
jgi:addiction module RelB/DinJ family antitoxin